VQRAGGRRVGRDVARDGYQRAACRERVRLAQRAKLPHASFERLIAVELGIFAQQRVSERPNDRL